MYPMIVVFAQLALGYRRCSSQPHLCPKPDKQQSRAMDHRRPGEADMHLSLAALYFHLALAVTLFHELYHVPITILLRPSHSRFLHCTFFLKFKLLFVIAVFGGIPFSSSFPYFLISVCTIQ